MTLREQPVVPLEVESLSPDVLAGLSNEKIRKLPAHLGKNRLPLEDFFTVEGEGSDDVKIVGDASKVKWIGRGMTRGRLTIEGNAGMHLGAYMEGGTIEVTGNAGDWLGAEMKGGSVRIGGDAGGQVGAAYRGSLAGMRGGTILIGGTASLEVGMRMLRGTIVVAGGVRDFAGLEMKGGTLLLGGAELRTGAWMLRGTIVSLKPIPILPTFAYASTYSPTFLRLYARSLDMPGFAVPGDGVYRRYTGDAAVPGKGELLVWEGASS